MIIFLFSSKWKGKKSFFFSSSSKAIKWIYYLQFHCEYKIHSGRFLSPHPRISFLKLAIFGIKKYLMYHSLYLFFAYPSCSLSTINTISTHSWNTGPVKGEFLSYSSPFFSMGSHGERQKKAIVHDIKIKKISNK